MSKEYQIFGIRAVMEAVEAGKSIDKVFIQKGLQGNLFKELQTLLNQNQISTVWVPTEKLNRLTKKNHQGVIANISPISYYELEDLVNKVSETTDNPIYLLLDHLSDVRNFGAIIRTAECTGVSGIIIPKQGAAPVTADTVKTSAGAVFNIPICKVNHLNDAVFYLQSSGIKVVAATEKTDKEIYNVPMNEPLAIVMGAEDKGISSSLLKICDEKAKLPMMGNIGSLNVSVACAVFLYEVVRQRR